MAKIDALSELLVTPAAPADVHELIGRVWAAHMYARAFW
jgi:hypothetical protein